MFIQKSPRIDDYNIIYPINKVGVYKQSLGGRNRNHTVHLPVHPNIMSAYLSSPWIDFDQILLKCKPTSDKVSNNKCRCIGQGLRLYGQVFGKEGISLSKECSSKSWCDDVSSVTCPCNQCSSTNSSQWINIFSSKEFSVRIEKTLCQAHTIHHKHQYLHPMLNLIDLKCRPFNYLLLFFIWNSVM